MRCGKGHSIATNGPLLRPKLGGKIPGHVFTAHTGEVLELQPELTLAVRDPVEYLEVIKNGTVFYSALGGTNLPRPVGSCP